MRIETKLFDENGMTIINKTPRKKENPAFFFFEFEALPKVGETVIFHEEPAGIFVVISIAHDVYKNKANPIVVMKKWENETRQEILGEYGWISGNECSPSAIEAERICIEN